MEDCNTKIREALKDAILNFGVIEEYTSLVIKRIERRNPIDPEDDTPERYLDGFGKKCKEWIPCYFNQLMQNSCFTDKTVTDFLLSILFPIKNNFLYEKVVSLKESNSLESERELRSSVKTFLEIELLRYIYNYGISNEPDEVKFAWFALINSLTVTSCESKYHPHHFTAIPVDGISMSGFASIDDWSLTSTVNHILTHNIYHYVLFRNMNTKIFPSIIFQDMRNPVNHSRYVTLKEDGYDPKASIILAYELFYSNKNQKHPVRNAANTCEAMFMNN